MNWDKIAAYAVVATVIAFMLALNALIEVVL